MKIAIIGTGRMGSGLIKTLYPVFGDDLLFAGRDVFKTQTVLNELSIPLTAVNEQQALEAEIIIPTLWYKDIIPWVTRYKEVLKRKVLVDITNPFNEAFDDLVLPYGYSSAEQIQKIIPETIVAGAFKNTFWTVFDRPVLQGIKSDVFVTCDNAGVRDKLIRDFGRLPFRFLDAGPIANNRTIERMTLLSSYLGKKAGNYPHIALNLWGLAHAGLTG